MAGWNYPREKGPLPFGVETSDGRIMRTLIDHIRDDEFSDIEIPEICNLSNPIELDNAVINHEKDNSVRRLQKLDILFVRVLHITFEQLYILVFRALHGWIT